MSRTNENIIKKLEYLKLDLNNIPESLTEYIPLKFRANKSYDDSYKIYRYVNVKDIEILLVDTHKEEELNKKYSQATPLKTYINNNPENEEDILKHTIFLKMLKELDIEDVEEIDYIQRALNKKVPFKVKYDKNYLWEVYYSESTKKHFILIPTKEPVNATLFYLIKKKIENKKNDKVFVPISNLDYTGEILKKAEIEDLEKYVWLFTKNWISIYEAEDYKNELTMQIVGNVKLYEQIESDFKVSLKTADEAKKFYNLIKALFILQTELPEYYNFEVSIDKNGGIEFLYNSKKVEYSGLFDFIKKEYSNFEKELIKIKKEYNKSNKELLITKEKIAKLMQEYNLQEKQIATYLNCRKSFFGKVKYFLNYKKKKVEDDLKLREKLEEPKELQEQKEEILLDTNKETCTIEDIVTICNIFDKKNTEYKNALADCKAQLLKLEIIEKKNENAKLYIEEIENHKKSIFEFWKFASKDEPLALNMGEHIKNEVNSNKRHKVFLYEDDIDEFGKSIDEYQRKILTKKNCDDIFKIINTNLDLINDIKNKKLLEQELKEKIDDFKQKEIIYTKDDFDIFGSVLEDKTKIKMLGKNKHREIEKNIYKLLNINEDLEQEKLGEYLQESRKSIKKIFENVKSKIDMPLYYTLDYNASINFNNLVLCDINSLDAVQKVSSNKVSLYKFNIEENMPILYLTNIIFYDNSNKTLPLGMDIQKTALMDLSLFEFELKNKKQIRINSIEADKAKIKNIYLYEYNLKLK